MKQDSYERHWSAESPLVSSITVDDLAKLKWKKSIKRVAGLGEVSELNVEGIDAETEEESKSIVSYIAALVMYMVVLTPGCSVQYAIDE